MQDKNLANVTPIRMHQPPQRRRAYRFVVDGTKYRLKYSERRSAWNLSFRTGKGMTVAITMNYRMQPWSIRVNGYTWTWCKPLRSLARHWIPDAEHLRNGLPDRIANVVNAALVDLKPQADALYEAGQEAERQASRQQIAKANRRRNDATTRQRRHLEEVLEQL